MKKYIFYFLLLGGALPLVAMEIQQDGKKDDQKPWWYDHFNDINRPKKDEVQSMVCTARLRASDTSLLRTVDQINCITSQVNEMYDSIIFPVLCTTGGKIDVSLSSDSPRMFISNVWSDRARLNSGGDVVNEYRKYCTDVAPITEPYAFNSGDEQDNRLRSAIELFYRTDILLKVTHDWMQVYERAHCHERDCSDQQILLKDFIACAIASWKFVRKKYQRTPGRIEWCEDVFRQKWSVHVADKLLLPDGVTRVL